MDSKTFRKALPHATDRFLSTTTIGPLIVRLLLVAMNISPDKGAPGHPDECRPTGTVLKPADSRSHSPEQRAVCYLSHGFSAAAFDVSLLVQKDQVASFNIYGPADPMPVYNPHGFGRFPSDRKRLGPARRNLQEPALRGRLRVGVDPGSGGVPRWCNPRQSNSISHRPALECTHESPTCEGRTHAQRLQPTDTIATHTDQILRHIQHRSGPPSWESTYPSVPFIPVEGSDGQIRLVTKSEATGRRTRIAIPDFEPLQDRIRASEGNRPAELAIMESRGVREPTTSELLGLGLQSLSLMV